jgi:hypothetical protein
MTGAAMLYETLPPATVRILRALLIGALGLLAALSLVLTFLAMPVAEDFCRGGLPKDIATALGRVVEEYNHWSGRWATHSIYYFTFPHIDMHSVAYNLLIFFSPFTWGIAFYAFLDILFRKTLTPKFKAFLAVLLCAMFWTGMSHQGDTWFWLTGLVEYELPYLTMALALWVATSDTALGRDRGRQISAMTLAAFLAFLTTGLHELPGMLFFGCMGIAIGLAFVRGRRDLMLAFGILALITFVGIIINVAAPGQAERAVINFPNARSPSAAINALISPRTSPIGWLADARLLCLTVLFLTIPVFARARPDWISWKLPLPGPFSSMTVMVPILTMAAVIAGFAITVYAQGHEAPGRVRDIMYATFIGGWVASLIPLTALVSDTVSGDCKLRRPLQTGALALFPVLLLIAPNTLYDIRDVPGIIRDWRPALQARYANLEKRAAAGETDIVVAQAVSTDPKAYRWDDLAVDATDWQNGCLAYYYKVRTIRLDENAAAAKAENLRGVNLRHDLK